jgi:hypothetical protein
MLHFKFTNDHTVTRLRLVMSAMLIFDMLNTLAGQPESFWHNAQTAIRGDGLSINNPTNHMFMFFLGHGWPAYLVTNMAYLLVLFLVIAVLPRKIALVTIFSVIFGYFFDTSNWLAVRWHLGLEGPFFYGLAVSTILAFAAFPANHSREAVKSLRWIMLFAMLMDAVVTLRGQPPGYWLNPAIVDEGNQVSKFFLTKGWYAYLFEQAVIILAVFRLIYVLPKRGAIITVLGFTFAGFIGASNWFFYRWILGMQAPVIFGGVLSLAIVLLTYSSGRKVKEAAETAAMHEAPLSCSC